jgi:hypothetical protein
MRTAQASEKHREEERKLSAIFYRKLNALLEMQKYSSSEAASG